MRAKDRSFLSLLLLLQARSLEMSDIDANDVARLEGTWKERLHTRVPLGLNDN